MFSQRTQSVIKGSETSGQGRGQGPSDDSTADKVSADAARRWGRRSRLVAVHTISAARYISANLIKHLYKLNQYILRTSTCTRLHRINAPTSYFTRSQLTHHITRPICTHARPSSHEWGSRTTSTAAATSLRLDGRVWVRTPLCMLLYAARAGCSAPAAHRM